MLFSCCFKNNHNPDSNEEKPNLREGLLNKETDKQSQIVKAKVTEQVEAISQNQPSKVEEKQPVIINEKLEQMKVIQSYSTVHKFEENAQIESQSQRISSTKSLIKMASQEESSKIKKQSDLWQQAGNKILYFVSQKDEEMVMTYKVSQRKVQSQLLDYVLKPHRFSSKFKNKPTDLSLSLVLSSQSLSKLKGIIANLIPDHHVRPIFGVCKKESEQKQVKNHYETEAYTQDIITVGNNCLRLQAFQRIIIMLNSQKDFSSIMALCQKITEHFELEQISKISFVFPAFLSLSQINAILSKINRKFLISEKLQKTINHLGFYVQLFEHTNFQEAIIVSSIENIYKQDEKINKDFEIKLELAIGLLMIQIDYNNAKLFSAVISNFLMDKTVSQYLKFIEFLHKDKKEFISKIQAMKIFDPQQLEEIQKSRKMQQKILSPYEKTITIKYRHKRKLGELFQEYHTTKTPVEQYQRKKEWDDDLRENDISATIFQQPDTKMQANCNIFEAIDDSYVQKADLDILPDDDQIQFQQDD